LKIEHHTPSDIERTSMEMISSELAVRGIVLNSEQEAVVKRVIHATADFDYAASLRFTPNAVSKAVTALQNRIPIVTDTNMAKAGISKPSLERLGSSIHCYMAEPQVAQLAKQEGTTRAVISMRHGAEQFSSAVFAVGNAPTALLELERLIGTGYRPALVIGVPVGFVNVVESKERVFSICQKKNIPAIVAMGRKGGSTVAAAICNALLYTALNALDPADRGWN
jgi:precorrin-8X/cobalt-precorrin-8 methylmutase